MSVGKAIVIIWTFLISGFAAWAEDSNPKLTGQDPNTQLSKATLWIGSGSDTKGESPSLNLVVFTRDHQTQLASLQRGQLCRENCQMQAGESQAISVTVDTPSATYQQCQGFDSYFFIDSNGQDLWDIDWLKVQLEFTNGANLVSATKVNRALEPVNTGEVLRKIGQGEMNGQDKKETSVIHWDQRPAF
jgi:hypothetical protein